MSIPIESYLPGVQTNGGIATSLPVVISSDLTVTGTTNIGGISLTDLTTTGNTTLGNAVTDTTTINGATTIRSTAAAGFAVGAAAAGATPAFVVDCSTSSQVTGLKVVGAASGGTVAVVVTQASGNANLTVNALGSGTIGIGTVSTGTVSIVPILGATLKCMVSTTSGASLNLGNAGTAPSAPNDGDMWIESNTIKVRLNGSTVTVTTS